MHVFARIPQRDLRFRANSIHQFIVRNWSEHENWNGDAPIAQCDGFFHREHAELCGKALDRKRRFAQPVPVRITFYNERRFRRRNHVAQQLRVACKGLRGNGDLSDHACCLLSRRATTKAIGMPKNMVTVTMPFTQSSGVGGHTNFRAPMSNKFMNMYTMRP